MWKLGKGARTSLQAAAFAVAVAVCAMQAALGQMRVQPWQQPYQGTDMDGETVLGYWRFDSTDGTHDASGKGHALTLRGGSRISPEGRFGACLESFGAAGRDQRNGAVIASHSGLTPEGAFTIEMWIKPKPEFHDPAVTLAWLVDKMYVDYAHANPKVERMRDYSLALRTAGDNRHTLHACLGFGDAVVRYVSEPLRFEADAWAHVAFAYDGNGQGDLYRDGEWVGGRRFAGRKGVVPGAYPLVIGDRVNSSFNGFPGLIDEVRLSAVALRFASDTVSISPQGRRVLQRMEREPPALNWVLRSNRGESLRQAVLVVETEGLGQERLAIPTLDPGMERTLSGKPFDASLRPGDYALRAWVEDRNGARLPGESRTVVTLVPRPLPSRMPVVMWGRLNLHDEKGFALRRETGFTHSFGGELVTYPQIWRAGKPVDPAPAGRMADYRHLLDEALRHGHAIFAYPLSPAIWVGRSHKEFQRVGRDGVPYANPRVAQNPCGLAPGLTDFCYNVGAAIANAYGAHPALQAALIHTEVRDNSQLCFHAWDRDAYRAETGREIPEGIDEKYGLHYRAVPGFPADRVVADDDPVLAYLSWFWKRGDGWNPMHSAVHRGLKSTGRDDLWTWYDPAVRVPSLWGCGGDVDVIAQWTYAYPDPVRIAQATDELFAMAQGAEHPQRVMKMTQIIWWRFQTAPKPKAGTPAPDKQADWERTDGDADFITIAPDALRIAFWTKIARPVQGIMYHDWPSLVDTGTKGGYRFTHSGAQPALAELIRTVVQPLGPALLQIPDPPSDVGFLQSFASQMLARRSSWGWSDDDVYLMLQYAHLQPRILYEESVLKNGLAGLKVLVLSQCDVLPHGVAERILAFQRDGGLIIGDEFLAPAIVPDIRIERYRRTRQADVDKAAIQAQAAGLHRELDPFYRRYADASESDAVVRVRRAGTTDYLFAVNDRRTFGDYVGHHGLVMEQGLPLQATLSLDRDGGYVYDLVTAQSVPASVHAGRLTIGWDFPPAGGALLMVTERPIGALELAAPAAVRLGEPLTVRITVADEAGAALDAVVPVEVALLDPEGRETEFSGYYATREGVLEVTFDLAGNDPAGKWFVRARERASGRTAERQIQVHR